MSGTTSLRATRNGVQIWGMRLCVLLGAGGGYPFEESFGGLCIVHTVSVGSRDLFLDFIYTQFTSNT